MSWAVNVPAGFASSLPGLPAAEFVDAVRAAKIEDTYNTPEKHAQLVAAKRVALEAFSVLARRDASPLQEDVRYTASMSGHANHDGAGDAGNYTTSEYIQVTVNRQPPRPKA